MASEFSPWRDHLRIGVLVLAVSLAVTATLVHASDDGRYRPGPVDTHCGTQEGSWWSFLLD
ncbi:MAG: hypothetical protein GY913_00460 [Proteobacteria bacterium]|nr:hypothetical protein [Pseudomonadota bacterium]MCP4915369.1 hypothetical protein [Pseudomonadota bacterium]